MSSVVFCLGRSILGMERANERKDGKCYREQDSNHWSGGDVVYLGFYLFIPHFSLRTPVWSEDPGVMGGHSVALPGSKSFLQTHTHTHPEVSGTRGLSWPLVILPREGCPLSWEVMERDWMR